MSSSGTAALLAWCADNRIQIDSTLQIVHGQQQPFRERALSVYSREQPIECPRTLVHIPKTAVLSVRSCFFSHRISSVPYGHGTHLALALALYGELLLGPRSRWFGYLQCLPQEMVDIALFWGVSDAVETRTCTCSADEQRQTVLSKCPSCVWLHDNQSAREWIQVTEIDREQLALKEEVRRYYHDVVEPTFHAVSAQPGLLKYDENKRDGPADANLRTYGVTFPGFCHVYSLVSTRAFWVDAYHGLAMVPVADAFNHTNDNHVQMESDYDVCVECGSLAECEHDRDLASTAVPVSLVSNVHPLSHDGTPTPSDVDNLEMRTVRPVPPFSEVFNTYGPLSNAVLLSRYGFMLPENECDTVRMVLDPLLTMRNLFRHVGLEDMTGREDDHAVTEASALGRLRIRNGGRERQPYSQGRVDNEATSVAVGAWEDAARRLLHVFTYVGGIWSSDAEWDERDEDGLVFNPQSSSTGPVPFQGSDGTARTAQDMVINADGKISHNLWLFCILVAMFAARSHSEASLEDVMGWVESGPGGVSSESLPEFRARLINVQRCVQRLCRIHDRDSVEGEMEDGGNHGSTSSPPFPHLEPSSLGLDYDTESDDIAQPAVQVQPGPGITSGGVSTSFTASSGSSSPHGDQFEPKVVAGLLPGAGPQDLVIRRSVSPAAQRSSELSRPPSISPSPWQRATRESYQETSSSEEDHMYGCSAKRDHRGSAERERAPKRARRDGDSVVANRVDRLGRATPESARQGRNREVVGGRDEDEVEMADDATERVAVLLARIVVCLCRDRYRAPAVGEGQRGVGMTAAELGEVLDIWAAIVTSFVGEAPTMPATRVDMTAGVGKDMMETTAWSALPGSRVTAVGKLASALAPLFNGRS